MIFEAVVTTDNPDGSAHVTPLGYRLEERQIVLAPFVPSVTLSNIRRTRHAVLNLTDDVGIIAGSLTGEQQWPLAKTQVIESWRLESVLEHREMTLARVVEDEQRPAFYFDIVHTETHGGFRGFNRAQAAIVEAAILLTRLDWLSPEKVSREMSYLKIAVEKTAGPREFAAWDKIWTAIQNHSRHNLEDIERQ